MSGLPSEKSSNHATEWSDAELTVAVRAYLGMLFAELDGKAYTKAEVNRRLREGPLQARSRGSIEFRMQNISAAVYDMKMPWISGYLPARDVGSAVKEKLIELLQLNGIDALSNFVPTANSDILAQRVSAIRKRGFAKMPTGSLRPPTTVITSTTYVRDPAVKAWVLKNANGVCEGCSAAAPFLAHDGLPYLEVHHVMPLASHGSDRVTNAVALCPNCHRRCHFSADKDEFKLGLYERVQRLILEVSEPSSLDTDTFINF